jgi:hypothetical protein
MHGAVPEKDTHSGPKRKLVCVIFAQTWPARATKGAKERIVRLDLKKPIDRCILLQNSSRHAIDQIARREKSLIPKTQRERRMSKKSKPRLHQVTVLALRHPVLLRGMRARDTMSNASALEIAMKPMILTTPVRLNGFDFSV